jgi:hypothetical protein
MDNKIKLLSVNTGSIGVVDVQAEKREMDPHDPLLKTVILTELNRMGKQSHVLIKYKGKLWKANHMAARGESKDYHKTEIKYHPLANRL